MSRTRLSLLGILLVTILALLIDLPQNIPLKFSVGSVEVDRVVNPPHLYIPALGIDRQIQTQLGLDLQGGLQLVLEADMQGVAASDQDRALEAVREIVERRVNFFGVSEPTVQSARVGESYRVVVELPGLKDVESAVQLIGQTAKLEFREVNQAAATSSASIDEVFPPTGVSGKDLKKAELAFNPQTGEPVVSFEMTSEGSQKFADLTERLVGKELAIFLDDGLVSAPRVESPITNGQGMISGGFTTESAKQLALTLSAGALPTPIHIIEQREIGASLGADSVAKSVRAGMVGLGFVALFMIAYYGYLGFLSVVALIIYGLITFALFRLIPVTLTLPGIAGFILSIGMAVDSNILIFARLREEVAKNTPWRIALELAFGRAWDSIRDANVTTLLTAFILYNPLNWGFIPVSGMVRGFAFTLALGVIVGLFTGIFVTRNLIRVFYKKTQITQRNDQ
ncbi:protein translocase subunit SecD [Candidatus Microgenomates bacterium]|nr:MAG: protein translocase subunit SecD [Candidatus Microgenomates bacterium]